MYASTDPSLTDTLIDYEAGYLTDPTELVNFFQRLVDTGLAWRLQGHYGRAARTLIDEGLVLA